MKHNLFDQVQALFRRLKNLIPSRMFLGQFAQGLGHHGLPLFDVDTEQPSSSSQIPHFL
jgi:hypothetical protein